MGTTKRFEEADPTATTPAGSTALVAGATAGIGRASTLQLAGLDAEVAVHGAQRRARRQDGAGNRNARAACFVAAGLSNADDARRLAGRAWTFRSTLASIGSATAETDDAFFDEHVNPNLRAPYIPAPRCGHGRPG